MMLRDHRSGKKRVLQRGATLLEALVGALLLVVIFLGASYALSRTLVSQANSQALALGLLETRERLQDKNLSQICGPQDTLMIADGLGVEIECGAEDIEVALESLDHFQGVGEGAEGEGGRFMSGVRIIFHDDQQRP